MLDIHEGPHGRFKILDHLKFGKKIKEWASDPTKAPTSIDELKKALEPKIAMVPTRYKEIRTVQAETEEFVLRLPPKAMIENTVKVLTKQANDHKKALSKDPGSTKKGYEVPPFYEVKMRGDGEERAHPSDKELNDLDFFFCRVADYTTSVCR